MSQYPEKPVSFLEKLTRASAIGAVALFLFGAAKEASLLGLIWLGGETIKSNETARQQRH